MAVKLGASEPSNVDLILVFVLFAGSWIITGMTSAPMEEFSMRMR